jgi:hypothetical protein
LIAAMAARQRCRGTGTSKGGGFFQGSAQQTGGVNSHITGHANAIPELA